MTRSPLLSDNSCESIWNEVLGMLDQLQRFCYGLQESRIDQASASQAHRRPDTHASNYTPENGPRKDSKSFVRSSYF